MEGYAINKMGSWKNLTQMASQMASQMATQALCNDAYYRLRYAIMTNGNAKPCLYPISNCGMWILYVPATADQDPLNGIRFLKFSIAFVLDRMGNRLKDMSSKNSCHQQWRY